MVSCACSSEAGDTCRYRRNYMDSVGYWRRKKSNRKRWCEVGRMWEMLGQKWWEKRGWVWYKYITSIYAITKELKIFKNISIFKQLFSNTWVREHLSFNSSPICLFSNVTKLIYKQEPGLFQGKKLLNATFHLERPNPKIIKDLRKTKNLNSSKWYLKQS